MNAGRHKWLVSGYLIIALWQAQNMYCDFGKYVLDKAGKSIRCLHY